MKYINTKIENIPVSAGGGGVVRTKVESIFTSVDGTTPTTLPHTPSFVFGVYNGSGQKLTNTVDYTISGAVITWLFAFQSTNIIVNYEY